METSNGSFGTDFILLGFSNRPKLELIISVLVFIFYMVALVGNSTIIIVSYLDSQLHTPMYFFLSNLSFLDLCYATSIVPQMLVNLWALSPKCWQNLWGANKSITYAGCVLQFFFALVFAATETLLLAVMASDHYAAVCQPLHCTVIMHPQLCQKMVLTCWLGGCGSAITVCSLTLNLPRCGHQNAHSFICEMPVLIKMACAYPRVIEIVIFAFGVVFPPLPLSLILISYGVITQVVMQIKSAGRRRTLYICGSHLTVVDLFYGTVIYMCIKPQNTTPQEEGKFFTLFYTIITPSLNPLIYKLRNKDVKMAVKRILVIEKSVHCNTLQDIGDSLQGSLTGKCTKIEIIMLSEVNHSESHFRVTELRPHFKPRLQIRSGQPPDGSDGEGVRGAPGEGGGGSQTQDSKWTGKLAASKSSVGVQTGRQTAAPFTPSSGETPPREKPGAPRERAGTSVHPGHRNRLPTLLPALPGRGTQQRRCSQTAGQRR
ncbi:LOW QUALITY PROTEIN: putative olfactory receptor 2W6 [Erethizon dorsatum]